MLPSIRCNVDVLIETAPPISLYRPGSDLFVVTEADKGLYSRIYGIINLRRLTSATLPSQMSNALLCILA